MGNGKCVRLNKGEVPQFYSSFTGFAGVPCVKKVVCCGHSGKSVKLQLFLNSPTLFQNWNANSVEYPLKLSEVDHRKAARDGEERLVVRLTSVFFSQSVSFSRGVVAETTRHLYQLD